MSPTATEDWLAAVSAVAESRSGQARLAHAAGCASDEYDTHADDLAWNLAGNICCCRVGVWHGLEFPMRDP
jgi:hypothetical protein